MSETTRCEVVGCGEPVGEGILHFCEPHWGEWLGSPESKSASMVSRGLAELGDGPAYERLRAQARDLARAVFAVRVQVPRSSESGRREGP